MPFDKNGEFGRKGNINTSLLNKLNKLPYYSSTYPKSLGREWVENEFFPVLDQFTISDMDKMRTIYEHIAIQIGHSFRQKGKVLITGGGAFNEFLVRRIENLSPVEIVIPGSDIIDFKEAIIFAFLGVLRITNTNNCLASVTGARKDSCGGTIHHFI